MLAGSAWRSPCITVRSWLTISPGALPGLHQALHTCTCVPLVFYDHTFIPSYFIFKTSAVAALGGRTPLPSCQWVHGFYAGMDAVGQFVRELKVRRKCRAL